MLVKELIKELQKMPQDAEVYIDIADSEWYELGFASDADYGTDGLENAIVLFAEERI